MGVKRDGLVGRVVEEDDVRGQELLNFGTVDKLKRKVRLYTVQKQVKCTCWEHKRPG